MYGSIVKLVNSHVGKRPRKKPKTFYSSSIGSCLAEQLFGLAGFEPCIPDSPRGNRIFDAGDDAEFRGNKWLRQSGHLIFGKNFKIGGERPFGSAKLDGFIGVNGFFYPYDWKSAGTWGFKKWVSFAGIDDVKAKELGHAYYDPRYVPNKDYRPVLDYSKRYYYQAQDYMHRLISNRNNKPKEDWSIFDYLLGEGFYFLVVNKDNSTIYEEFIPYDPEPIAQRLLTLRAGYGIIERKPKPTERVAKRIREVREYELVKGKFVYPCKSCSFLKQCWGKEYPILVNKELEKHK